MSTATMQRPPVRNPTPQHARAPHRALATQTEWTMADVLDRLHETLPDQAQGTRHWTADSFVSVAALPRVLRGLDPAPIFALLTVDDLAMTVRRLAAALQTAAPGHPLIEQSLIHLKANGLAGDPLREAPTKPAGGGLARLAGMLCQQPAFLAFAKVDCSDAAADWIRSTCQIKSRAELDHNPSAAHRFHELVRKPYVATRGGAA